MMTSGEHFYKNEDLIESSWLEENFPGQISTDWEKYEFSSFDELLHSGDDGFLSALPGRSTDANNGSMHHNLGPDVPFSSWIEEVNSFPSLKLILINKALIIPSDDRIFKGKRCFISEVRDSTGRLVPESMARMKELTISEAKVERLHKDASNLKGTYLYGGKFWSHYGHFTIETLSTLWPYSFYNLNARKIKPIYSVENIKTGIKLGYITEALNRCGIAKEDVSFAIEPVIVERLIIAIPSARIHSDQNNYIHPTQKQVWSSIAKNQKSEPKKKFYFSRRLYRERNLEKRPLAGEEDLEKLFRSNDFEIIHPEKLLFHEQLEIFKQAKVIAGPIGSNLLNSAYASDHISLVAFSPISIISRTQIMLSDIKHLHNYFFFSFDEHILHDSQDSWSINLQDLEDFLKKHDIIK